MTLPLSIVTHHYAIAFPFDDAAGKAKFWAHAEGLSEAVNFDFMVHDNPDDPRPYRYEVTDVDNGRLLPQEVLSALVDQDFFVSSTLFEPVQYIEPFLDAVNPVDFVRSVSEMSIESLCGDHGQVLRDMVAYAERFPDVVAAGQLLPNLAAINPSLIGDPTGAIELIIQAARWEVPEWDDYKVGRFKYIAINFNTNTEAFCGENPAVARHAELITVLKNAVDLLFSKDLLLGEYSRLVDSNGNSLGSIAPSQNPLELLKSASPGQVRAVVEVPGNAPDALHRIGNSLGRIVSRVALIKQQPGETFSFSVPGSAERPAASIVIPPAAPAALTHDFAKDIARLFTSSETNYADKSNDDPHALLDYLILKARKLTRVTPVPSVDRNFDEEPEHSA